MPDQHTVLYQVLKHVPEGRFKELVKIHRSDEAARGLDSKSQFVALLYGQLSGASSLREIVDGWGATRSGCPIWAAIR